MSFNSEFRRGVRAVTAAVVLGVLAVVGADWMRSEGHWAPAVQIIPETASSEAVLDLPPDPQPAINFETLLETQLSWGVPILDVFALCHGRTRLLTGDSEFRHSRVEGVDWLEYYESVALPGDEIAIRGFRAPMPALSAASEGGLLVIAARGTAFIGGAWHVTANGEIDDALELEGAPGLAIPACLDADAAAAQLNVVFAGDRSQVRARLRG